MASETTMINFTHTHYKLLPHLITGVIYVNIFTYKYIWKNHALVKSMKQSQQPKP